MYLEYLGQFLAHSVQYIHCLLFFNPYTFFRDLVVELAFPLSLKIHPPSSLDFSSKDAYFIYSFFSLKKGKLPLDFLKKVLSYQKEYVILLTRASPSYMNLLELFLGRLWVSLQLFYHRVSQCFKFGLYTFHKCNIPMSNSHYILKSSIGGRWQQVCKSPSPQELLIHNFPCSPPFLSRTITCLCDFKRVILIIPVMSCLLCCILQFPVIRHLYLDVLQIVQHVLFGSPFYLKAWPPCYQS